MPHFWAAGRHAGVMRRADLKRGYDLMTQSVGGFGAWFVAAIPVYATVLMGVIALAACMLVDWDRPGGILGPDCSIEAGVITGGPECQADLSFTREAEWPLSNSIFFTVLLGGTGYLLGFYVWQPLKWYAAAWGDTLVLEERGGQTVALLRTKLHRLSFVNHQAQGYYRGNAREGHISRARMLLRYVPPERDAEGRIIGEGHHPSGLATCLITDLYLFGPGTGHSTDDPGRAYEASRVQIKTQADKARALSQRGYNRLLRIDTIVYLLAGAILLVGSCQFLALTGGGEVIVDPSFVGDNIGLGGG